MMRNKALDGDAREKALAVDVLRLLRNSEFGLSGDEIAQALFPDEKGPLEDSPDLRKLVDVVENLINNGYVDLGERGFVITEKGCEHIK